MLGRGGLAIKTADGKKGDGSIFFVKFRKNSIVKEKNRTVPFFR